MKTADLKAGVAYATCEGQYVVPVSPVSSSYQTLVTPAEGGARKEIIDTKAGNDDPENPWGACHKVTPANSYRTGKLGVKVLRFEVDADGEPINGSDVAVILQPRDIAGTWKEYLTLYGHVVRERAETRERERLLSETSERLDEVIKAVSGNATYRRGYRGQPDSWFISLEVGVGDDGDPDSHERAVQVARAIVVAVQRVREEVRGK